VLGTNAIKVVVTTQGNAPEMISVACVLLCMVRSSKKIHGKFSLIDLAGE